MESHSRAQQQRSGRGRWGAPSSPRIPDEVHLQDQPLLSRSSHRSKTTALAALREQFPDGIPEEEVAKHNTESSPWIVVKDKVYDCSSYLNEHPGGASSILLLAGQDATDDFEAVHSTKAWDLAPRVLYW